MSEKTVRERDVLSSIRVTLDVSHFERSPLNTEASKNAIQRIKKIKSYAKRKKVENYLLIKDSLSI
jgi:hypothetical protein